MEKPVSAWILAFYYAVNSTKKLCNLDNGLTVGSK